MKTLTIAALLAVAVLIQPACANVLKSGSLPMCGPDDASFRQLRAGLKQSPAWQGKRLDRAGLHSGVLELTIGRSGEWSLFFRYVDPDGQSRICLVARGVGSHALFGTAL